MLFERNYNNQVRRLMTTCRHQAWDPKHQKATVKALMVRRYRNSFETTVLTRITGPSSAAIDSANPPKPAAASGLLHGALEGQDEDGDDDEDDRARADLNGGESQSSNGNPILSLSTQG